MESTRRPHFGLLLRQFRAEAGMTQQELAERAKMSAEAIGALERGTRTRPRRDTVLLLGNALVLSADQQALLEGTAELSRRASHQVRLSGVKAPVLRLVGPDESPATPHNLPRSLTSFVGRERACGEITDLLGRHGIVTLVGSGGVGKTRVALEIAGSLLDRYPDGVWLVDLAPVPDPEHVGEAILRVLEIPSSSGPPTEAIVAYLKRRRTLLLLDNCEHVVAAVGEVVAAVAQSCPGVHLLSTSRQGLEVAGECAYGVPSLDNAAAVQLFSDRARTAHAGFALGAENAAAVEEICGRLDGIPFAIELAAARVCVLAPRQIADRLDERFRLLSSVDTNAAPRHRTMTALLEWSYDLLSAREQRFFEALSVFAGGCTLEAATAVCAEDGEDEFGVLDLIASLVNRSLLVAELAGETQRYRFLETMRQYAAQKLAQRGATDEVARRHAQAYLALAQRLEAAMDTTSDRELLAASEPEQDNWRAALRWTLGKGRDIRLGQRICALAPDVVWSPATSAEGTRWLGKALALICDATPAALVADLHLADAHAWGISSNPGLALLDTQRALLRYRALGDSLGVARAQGSLGFSLVIYFRLDEGEALLHEALLAARRLDKPRLTARVLTYLGYAKSYRNDFAAGRAYLAEAFEIATAVGANRQVAKALAVQASLEYDAGEVETAIRLTRLAIEKQRSLSAPVPPAWTVHLALLLTVAGQYAEARTDAAQAVESAIEYRMSGMVVLALQTLVVPHVLGNRSDLPAAEAQREAKLLGFVETHFPYPKVYGLISESERAVEMLRDLLGPDEVARLMAAGAAMAEDAAVEEARALV